MSDRHAALYTAGDRSFATAACPRTWNGRPDDVTPVTSLLTFRRKQSESTFISTILPYNPDIILRLSLSFAMVEPTQPFILSGSINE